MKTSSKDLPQEVEKMLQAIIDQRPRLKELKTDKKIFEYLRPGLEWRQRKDIFPYASLLSKIITGRIKKLYGEEIAKQAEKQLEEGWVIETGAHLHIPRRYNRVSETTGAQINSLLFQGQVLWALANKSLQRNLVISLNSGRVPLDNTNSGVYLDLPALKVPMPLSSKKRYPESPQSLIPATDKQEIEKKMRLLSAYRDSKTLPEEQHELGQQILKIFWEVQSSFSDQVSKTHAFMLDKILPIKQVTLDSELIGVDFIIALLEDKKSLTHTIFDNSDLRNKFLEKFANIRTGWTKEGSPFHAVTKKDKDFYLGSYTGDLSPKSLIKGLKERAIWPTGVLKFFVFMTEAGIFSAGGWTQANYCSDIRLQAEKLLNEQGLSERAEILSKMPTHIAAVTACWGVDEYKGNLQLLDAITSILNPDCIDISKIADLKGEQGFLVAAPTLYEFILDENPPLGYNDLKDMISFAFVRTNPQEIK